MALAPILPRAQAALIGAGGNDPRFAPSKEWFDFFRALLAAAQGNADLADAIAQLIARLEAIEGSSIVGPQSVQVFGSLDAGGVTLLLRGDVSAPGALYHYGTDVLGIKGWNASASFDEYLVDEDGLYLVDESGNYLVGRNIEADLFAITGTGAGLLAKTAGAAYAARTISTSGDAGLSVADGNGVAGNPTISHSFGATLSAGGTTAQFWRGDKAWSNWLDGDLRLGQSAGIGGGRELLVSVGASTATIARVGIRGHRSGAGNLGTLLFYNAASSDANVAGLAAATNGADDSGIFLMSAKATGVAAANVLAVEVTAVRPFTNNTITCGSTAARWSTTFSVNLVLGAAAASFGGGAGVIFLSNATTVPTSNPTGGSIIYAEAGAAKTRGTSGTVTTFGPANPHCPACGSDFVHEWDNPERWGYLAVCMLCYANGAHSVTRERGAWNTH